MTDVFSASHDSALRPVGDGATKSAPNTRAGSFAAAQGTWTSQER